MKFTRARIMDRRMITSRGFTLIELMVVIMMIGMLTTVIVPSMVSAMRRGGLASTAEQMLDMIQFAHMSAISRHQRVVLNIDSRRSLCWISTTAASLPWVEGQVESKSAPLVPLALPSEIDVVVERDFSGSARTGSTLGWETITFESDGSTDTILISMMNGQGERAEIQLFGLTGEVTLLVIPV